MHDFFFLFSYLFFFLVPVVKFMKFPPKNDPKDNEISNDAKCYKCEVEK